MQQFKPTNNEVDFLDTRYVLQYLLVFALVLLAGWIGKDLTVILIITIILFFCLSKNLFFALNVWLIWFFTQGFYVGQNFIHNSLILNYFSKPSFILFIIFLFFFNTIPKTLFKKLFLISWLVFIFTALESSLYNDQMPFVLITISSFFFLYLLLTSTEISRIQYQKILNLFVTVAILQTFVSLLQVLEILPPATKLMSDGFGGIELWKAALDDAASGTFGPDSSHLVSWYVSMIALFATLIWVMTRRLKYIVVVIISLAQFATVDSKTVMAVMAVMILYLLFFLLKNRLSFSLTLPNFFKMISIAIGLAFSLLIAWNMYYEDTNSKYGNGQRGDLHSVYKNEVAGSFNAITEHWTEWGKIQGFHYVFDDFLNNPIQIICGYGLQGYNYNGKMKYIESLDTPIMQSDDSTRSRSGLIALFATTGIVGFALIFISLFDWYKFNLNWCKLNLKLQEDTSLILITLSMVKIFSFFSLLLAFLYSFDLTSIPIISFAGLVAVLKQYSELTDTTPDEPNIT